MKIIPQTRRSIWTCNGVELVSTIVCVGRSFHRVAGRGISYRSLYTVELEFGTRVARVRAVPNAEALAWETKIVLMAFVELGAIAP